MRDDMRPAEALSEVCDRQQKLLDQQNTVIEALLKALNIHMNPMILVPRGATIEPAKGSDP